jgi:hypothetical protein
MNWIRVSMDITCHLCFFMICSILFYPNDLHLPKVSHRCFKCYKCLRSENLVMSQTIALTGAALQSVGPMPRKKVPMPSFRYDFIAQSSAFKYFCPGPVISVCKRVLITSFISSVVRITDPWDRQSTTLLRQICNQKFSEVINTMHRRDIISMMVYPPV